MAELRINAGVGIPQEKSRIPGATPADVCLYDLAETDYHWDSGLMHVESFFPLDRNVTR